MRGKLSGELSEGGTGYFRGGMSKEKCPTPDLSQRLRTRRRLLMDLNKKLSCRREAARASCH